MRHNNFQLFWTGFLCQVWPDVTLRCSREKSAGVSHLVVIIRLLQSLRPYMRGRHEHAFQARALYAQDQCVTFPSNHAILLSLSSHFSSLCHHHLLLLLLLTRIVNSYTQKACSLFAHPLLWCCVSNHNIVLKVWVLWGQALNCLAEAMFWNSVGPWGQDWIPVHPRLWVKADKGLGCSWDVP